MSESKWFRPEIETVSARYDLEPDLIEAIVRVESSGLAHAYRFEPGFWTRYLADDTVYDGANPRRVSASYGLMQVMYPVARELGYDGQPEGLFAPLVSLEYGCKKLRTLINWCGSRDGALAAYNGGQKGNAKPPYRNQLYVDKVLQRLEDVKGGR